MTYSYFEAIQEHTADLDQKCLAAVIAVFAMFFLVDIFEYKSLVDNKCWLAPAA
jgi:hypothetical protein